MSEPKRPHGTPEWVVDFAKAICPESPNLLLSTDEKNILTAATQKILDLEAELTQLRAELAEAVRLLQRVTEELNRFHLNEKKWIGNPFECPICRMIESAKNAIKRQEAKHE